ncbi:hypothetical protein MA16_Dca000184 [Dendrobium catenatum]|uniref:Uncharacterized protein n=1 Tax=Dendrobium catenatum TaxID=906689 RepID=A0A2I0WT63_9ASPA|nr:hypothetical protein MA16_Dca000184 [Dendrobium catenatum]
MSSKLMEKTSITLLVISAFLLLKTSAASKQNIVVVGGVNQTSINGFFWPEINHEDQAAGLEGSLSYSTQLSYKSIEPNNPIPRVPKPGESYTGRGCNPFYQCRSK